jgi:hypothetical protein
MLGTLRLDEELALRGSVAGKFLLRNTARISLDRRGSDEEFHWEVAEARKLNDPLILRVLGQLGERYGIAEWLAAGPELELELERARSDPRNRSRVVGSAIVDAAIDCHLAGFPAPLPEDLLFESHRLYLRGFRRHSSQEEFREALEWCREPIAGTAALLVHHHEKGDKVFDYLIEPHARRKIKSSLWPILLRHVTPRGATTLALGAHRHGQSRVVRELIRRVRPSARPLLFSALGDETSLSGLAREGNRYADAELARLRAIAERGSLPANLRIRVEQPDTLEKSDPSSPDRYEPRLDLRVQLPDVFRRHPPVKSSSDTVGRQPNRVAQPDIDPGSVAMVNLLAENGEIEQLEIRADHGDDYAAQRLIEILVKREDTVALGRRTKMGDQTARKSLIEILTRNASVDELADLADSGDVQAGLRLVELLVDLEDLEFLDEIADRGDSLFSHYAARLLAELLTDQGEIDHLAARAARGDRLAAQHLNLFLVDRGDAESLQQRAIAADPDAAY